MTDINYSTIPVDYMTGAMIRYISHGVPPGDFLQALLSNNLVEAFKRADKSNQLAMAKWVQWLYCEAPSSCWGSPDKMAAWIAHRGLNLPIDKDSSK